MSKKWSSFGEQQLLTENWREFLTEEEIEEGLFDRVKATAKGAYKGGKEAWEKSRPPVMSDYPATELTTIINMISKADPTADTAKIVDELEAMLKAQNFVINEQDDKIMLGADLELKLDPKSELARVLLKLEKENPNYYNQIVKAFGRGGFDVSAIPLADAKPKQPTAEPQQIDTTGASYVPTSGGLDAYPQPGEPEEIPTGDKAEREPEAQPSQQQGNFDRDSGVPISVEGRDILMGQIEKATTKEEFQRAYYLLNKSKYGGKNPLESILQKVDKFDENTSAHDIIGAIMEISSFGKKDGSIITRGKFEELFLTPEQRKAYRDNIKASNEIKDILKNDFESEAFKRDFPQYADYNFDQEYAAFISDLRALVSKINELSRGTMASGLGVDVKQISALAEKYPPIFKVISRFQPSKEEQQMFLSDLLNVVRGTPKKAEKAPSPEETPTVIKTPEEPEKEEFLKFPDDFPEDLKDIHRQANLSPFKNEDREQKMKLLKASKFGAMGIIMDLARDETMGGTLQWKKTGEFEKGATKEPLEHWQKLYKKITDKEIRNLSKETRFLAKAYLLGLKNQIEQKGAIQEDKETLNESTMVRWKELAGIL